MIKDLVSQENLKVSNAVSTAKGYIATHKNVIGGLPPVSLKISGKTVQNGTPAPDNKVDIEGAGASGSLTVKSTGKNFFDESKLLNAEGWTLTDGYYTGTSNALQKVYGTSSEGLLTEFEENTQYSISVIGKCAANTSNNARLIVTHTDGTQNNYMIAKSTTATKYSYTTDTTKTVKTIHFEYGASDTIYLKNFQIEKGDKATPFEPYAGTEVNIALDAPLYEGDYIRYNMDGTGEESHKKKMFVFNGSDEEPWTRNGGSDTQYYGIDIGDYNSFNNENLLCSHFTYNVINSTTTNIGIGIVNSTTTMSSRVSVRPNIDGVTNLDTWKAWLQSNPITVVCEREEEEVTPLTTEQITAIESLVAQDGLTNVMSEGMVESGYLSDNADGKAVLSLSKIIDQRVNDLKNTNQSEHTALSKRITALENNGWTKVAHKIMGVDLSSYKEVLVVLSGGDVQYVTINIPFDELDGGTNVYGTGVYLTPESYWGGYVEIDSEGVYDHAFYMTGVKEEISNIAVYAR